MTITDPLCILPAAVEAAQHTASEIVADAIRAAERAGYERGVREAAAASPAIDVVRTQRLVAKLMALVDEIDTETLCVESSTAHIEVPTEEASLTDWKQFAEDYGGAELVNTDDTRVSGVVEIDRAKSEASAMLHVLARLLRGEPVEPEDAAPAV
jgi:hypothetical protein